MVINRGFENIIRSYPEQGYFTCFNRNTGLFARIEKKGHQLPFWAIHGPEMLDVSITNWCDRNCSFCYRNSDIAGKHMSIESLDLILKQAHEIGVCQIALGGGNPNQHPNFSKILNLIREKYDIVPTYTTNGRGLSEEVIRSTKKYCGAVAVSAYPPFREMVKAIRIFTSRHIKTNIHFLLTNKSIETAISWLKNPPEILTKINALVFLNYKPVGNNVDLNLLLSKSKRINKFFNLLSQKRHDFKVGFDSCSISGVIKYLNIDYTFLEACEAGRFSCFISEEMKMYPCSFMEGKSDGAELKKNRIIDIWKYENSFKEIRERIYNNSCSACGSRDVCLGGCPFFKSINFC